MWAVGVPGREIELSLNWAKPIVRPPLGLKYGAFNRENPTDHSNSMVSAKMCNLLSAVREIMRMQSRWIPLPFIPPQFSWQLFQPRNSLQCLPMIKVFTFFARSWETVLRFVRSSISCRELQQSVSPKPRLVLWNGPTKHTPYSGTCHQAYCPI
jgi:hypothetical protein